MGNILAYSGLVTKVRAMQAKLLTREDFEKIASMHSVPEIVAFLKEKPAYREHFAAMDESMIHRGILKRCWCSHCTAIISVCTGLPE